MIVHKIDRLARSREDDVLINMEIRAAGAQLVSCTENIDQTPPGLLLHGIMSSIAEFYSRNLANEVAKGMLQKAQSGGTIGKAPLGYLNSRAFENGREARIVTLDPDRAPLMKWAFETYATGEWTIRKLLAELTERGLTAPATRPKPERPIAVSHLNRLLRSRYYIGEVRYQGVWYPGNHEALVDHATWQRVQDALDAHDQSGEKHRKHEHYLKGTIWCGTCGARLCVANSTGKMGTIYPYFICLGRQRDASSCSQRAIPITKAVAAVEACYRELQLTPDRADELRTVVTGLFEQQRMVASVERIQQERAIQRLLDERQKVLDAHYKDAIPVELLRTEMKRIERARDTAQIRLDAARQAATQVGDAFEQALELAANCRRFYMDASPALRRMLNQAFSEKLYLSWEDGETRADRAAAVDLFTILFDTETAEVLTETPRRRSAARRYRGADRKDGRGACNENRRPSLVGAATLVGSSSSKELLVREGGLEPPHPFGHRNLNPARLPIPPLPQ